MIRLRDRFKTTTVAAMDENGKIVIRHGSEFLANEARLEQQTSQESQADNEAGVDTPADN